MRDYYINWLAGAWNLGNRTKPGPSFDPHDGVILHSFAFLDEKWASL
jgi:hypothetical protein